MKGVEAERRLLICTVHFNGPSPFAALTDDSFIISDGEPSLLRKSIRERVAAAPAANMNKHRSIRSGCSHTRCPVVDTAGLNPAGYTTSVGGHFNAN